MQFFNRTVCIPRLLFSDPLGKDNFTSDED
ncbi:hypothetical protein TRL7639_04258 [Falsiruegeria litorea R37]|uniref:Uncharacterized protein n=1 Tax=Falsiruegeria litorea R37 TaxID=1200284 RepID=A0A1Y5TT93_9RHOB|nr:hypothetical protein TRL7639_04258 [Falsiruegeria litorea R37]